MFITALLFHATPTGVQRVFAPHGLYTYSENLADFLLDISWSSSSTKYLSPLPWSWFSSTFKIRWREYFLNHRREQRSLKIINIIKSFIYFHFVPFIYMRWVIELTKIKTTLRTNRGLFDFKGLVWNKVRKNAYLCLAAGLRGLTHCIHMQLSSVLFAGSIGYRR